MRDSWVGPFLVFLVAYSDLAEANSDNPMGPESLRPAEVDSMPLFILDPVVVTTSRVRETGLRTPASVTVIDNTRIGEAVLFTPVDAARNVTGVDFASKGLNQQTFAVRGDRSVNSTAIMMMTDYRYAAVPSLGFNIPYLLSQSPDDIQRIEVVRGPGAALYGPDSDKGVLHIITRSPFESHGTRISAAGGERSLYKFGFRHASVLGEHWAFKVSGEYFRGDDWETRDSTEVRNRARAIAAGADADTLRIGKRDFRNERWAGEARLDWRSGTGSSLTLTGGRATAVNNIDLIDTSGGIQVRDWRYGYGQIRGKHGRFFANLYLNSSNSGDTYFLRSGLTVVDESVVVGAQLQHGADAEDGRFRFLYGVDLRTTDPRTGGTINGRNENNDTSSEIGAYLHSTSEISEALDVVAALRGDYHDRLGDAAVSPRLGLVYRPSDTQTLRAVYNRAFNSPSSTELFIDLAENQVGPYTVRLNGIPQDGGFTFSRDCGGAPCMWVPGLTGPAVRAPADATAAWDLVVVLLQQQGTDISGVTPPAGTDVGTVLATLDPVSEDFLPIPANSIRTIEPLERTLTNSVEIGYKGVLWERASVQTDLYYWHRKNPVGDIYVATPSVFFNQSDLAAYLDGQGVPSADSLAAVISGIPVGTISPDQVGASTDLLVLNRQGGAYDNVGLDVALEVELTRKLWAGVAYSWILDNSYSDVDVLGDVVLGVPKNKGSVSLGIRDRGKGWSATLRARMLESFPVANGVYRGRVNSYAALDLDATYRLPAIPEVRVSISSANLFDNHHREFLGAPDIGRLVVGRVEVWF